MRDSFGLHSEIPSSCSGFFSLYRVLFLAQFTVFFRCFACENMKGADKVAVVVESAELGGFGNGLAAI